MIEVDAVVLAVDGVAAADVADWIARGWVAPAGAPPDWLFADIDVARVRLVRDLRHQAGIGDEALPVVLSLLDQMYDLRHALQRVLDAVATLPPPARNQIMTRLRE